MTLEAHIDVAIDLGEELIASNALRFERFNVIGTHFGREALDPRSASVSGAILLDIARMLGLPFFQTEDGLTIPEDSHTLDEAADRFVKAHEVYAQAAHEAMITTLECDPSPDHLRG
jgi:hypothetical protein